MRVIRVIYSYGSVITTEMEAHLTDDQLLAYFKIGRVLNLGGTFPDLEEDNEQTVVKAEILN